MAGLHSRAGGCGVLAPALLALLAACAGAPEYRQPIGDFQNASSIVTESARLYITELNKTQRDAYIDQQVAEGRPITLAQIEAVQAFSPEGIEARLRALDELAKYGDLLARLAGSDAPEAISWHARDLAGSLERLESRIGGLRGGRHRKFKDAFGPVALLIGEIARLGVERQIRAALDKAVLDGEWPVKELIRTIRDDLVLAYELKRSALTNNRVIYVDGYEIGRAAGHDLAQQRGRGEEIKRALDLWEALPTSNPAAGLDALADAHDALLAYARSAGQPADVAAFAGQMETFVARASRVGYAVRRLQQRTD